MNVITHIGYIVQYIIFLIESFKTHKVILAIVTTACIMNILNSVDFTTLTNSLRTKCAVVVPAVISFLMENM